MKDWKFARIMKYSGLQFTERQMLKIIEGLGGKGRWRHAFSVVEWVYSSKEHRHYKSRYTWIIEHMLYNLLHLQFRVFLFTCSVANLGLYTQNY